MHTIIKVTLCLIIALSSINSLAATPKFDNLTIVVSSCDKYSSLWPPFFALLFKQWPSLLSDNSEIPILLISNHKSYADQRVKTINADKDISWSNNMLQALAQVKTKYVLIILDDYWIDTPVNEQRLSEIYQLMQKADAAKVQLGYPDWKLQNLTADPNIPYLAHHDRFAQYKTSLQLSLWNTEALMFLLKPGEDPWAFELSGSVRSHGYPKPFLMITKDYPIQYINAVHQGHMSPDAEQYAAAQNINYTNTDFPKLKSFNFKRFYQKWKIRISKTADFLRHPGLFHRYDISAPQS